MFDELKEVKSTLKKLQISWVLCCNVKYFKEIKHFKSLHKAEVYLEPKWGSTMERFCEYI